MWKKALVFGIAVLLASCLSIVVFGDFEAPPEDPGIPPDDGGDDGNGSGDDDGNGDGNGNGDGDGGGYDGLYPIDPIEDVEDGVEAPILQPLPKIDIEGPEVDNPNPVLGDTICFSFRVLSEDDKLDYLPPYIAFYRLLPDDRIEVLAGECSYMPFILGDDGVWRVCVDTSILSVPGIYRAYMVVRRPANDCDSESILTINVGV
ncbi:hypothetical protein KJ562_03185 [Patescibacteria group bacterium]|nr:hypothetical protein [Patescibacteria group bacterium]MBU4162118.1 hypothetical protein [Patescibacteria group bacterium]